MPMEVKQFFINPGNQQRAQNTESAPRADTGGEGNKHSYANALLLGHTGHRMDFGPGQHERFDKQDFEG